MAKDGMGVGVKSSTEEIAFNPHIEFVQKLCSRGQYFRPSGLGLNKPPPELLSIGILFKQRDGFYVDKKVHSWSGAGHPSPLTIRGVHSPES